MDKFCQKEHTAHVPTKADMGRQGPMVLTRVHLWLRCTKATGEIAGAEIKQRNKENGDYVAVKTESELHWRSGGSH